MKGVKFVDYKFKNNETELYINESVVCKVNAYRQMNREDCESGGLLIGRTDIHGKTRIYEITEPMKKDLRNRFAFKRLDKRHLEEVKIANDRCLYFKGNWHTHPQSIPTPSWLDVLSWKKAIKESKPGESKHIFFIIIGTDKIKAWCGNMMSGQIEELEYQKEEEL